MILGEVTEINTVWLQYNYVDYIQYNKNSFSEDDSVNLLVVWREECKESQNITGIHFGVR